MQKSLLAAFMALMALLIFAARCDVATASVSSMWGYAGAKSVPQGGTIDLHVSTTAPRYDLVVYRWGAVVQQMAVVRDLPGASYPCADSQNGCGWPVSYQLQVPHSWRSGLYFVRLLTPGEDLNRDYGERIWFVVREDQPGSTSPILYMLNENTWQAYNYRAGLSFYDDPAVGRGRSNWVSFDRPYSGPSSTEWGGSPVQLNLPLIVWLEQNGYTVEYAANWDVHADATLLSHYRLFMNDAHDEYWSWEMRDHVEDFIARGGNAAFFSSNTSYWQVRFEDNGRRMIGYKGEVAKDPVLLMATPRMTIWRRPSFAVRL